MLELLDKQNDKQKTKRFMSRVTIMTTNLILTTHLLARRLFNIISSELEKCIAWGGAEVSHYVRNILRFDSSHRRGEYCTECDA